MTDLIDIIDRARATIERREMFSSRRRKELEARVKELEAEREALIERRDKLAEVLTVIVEAFEEDATPEQAETIELVREWLG